MNWYKIAKEVSGEYSWVYLELPKDIQDSIIEFGKKVDEKDLYKDEAENGLEKDPHITIKYGLLTEDVKEVKECLNGLSGGKAHIGASSIFDGGKYDVVKMEVESSVLNKLHEALNKLPHEDKYLEYQSHATIAYVKKGFGKKYNLKFKLNKDFSFGKVFFGNSKKDFEIKLSFCQ